MLIKIVPLYSECGVTKAVVTAYPEKDVTSCSSKYKYTGKLDEFKSLSNTNLETNVINLYRFYSNKYVIMSALRHNIIEMGRDPLVDAIYELADAVVKTTDKDISRIIKKYNMEEKLKGGK